ILLTVVVAMVAKMAAAETQAKSTPSSPAPSEGSCRSQEILQDLEIRELTELTFKGVSRSTTKLFNLILEEATDNQIIMDRAHKSLRPRGALSEAPRDMICKLHYFSFKDNIFKSSTRDFSATFILQQPDTDFPRPILHTLQARWALKPITEHLRNCNIKYRWGFQLALNVTHKSTVYSIATHLDIKLFLRAPELPNTQITDWYIPQPN
ncbi:Hypothetical predicted protein, partial [Pelobates cultripes]